MTNCAVLFRLKGDLVPERSYNYNWSDAWLLFSIIIASNDGEANLERIIAAGDAINVSIFKPQEVESGLVRLTSGGYVEEKDGVFMATAKARRSPSMIKSLFGFSPNSVDNMEKLIGAAPAASRQPHQNDLKYPGFSVELFKEAYKRYFGQSNFNVEDILKDIPTE